MISSVKTGVAVAEPPLAPRPVERDAVEAFAPALPDEKPARPVETAPQSDLRLVIERGESNAFYVYRLVDRVTGKVVVELPRDQVADLATTPSYEAGTVVRTTA